MSTLSNTNQDGAKVTGHIALQIVEVTPALAQEWLTRNTTNRPLRRNKVDAYAKQMADGNWRSDREPIEFLEDGTLGNGQHRLHGVIKSGRSVSMPVRYNIKRDDMAIMDTGLQRQASDVLSLGGFKNAKTLAGAAKVLYLWRNYPSMTMLRAGSHLVNNELIAEFVSFEPSLADSVDAALAFTRRYKRLPASLVAALHYEIKQYHGVDLANEFFKGVTLGIGLEDGSPILALRQILDNRVIGFNPPPTELRLAWSITAFNKWAAGEQAKLIKHMKSMDFPKLSH